MALAGKLHPLLIHFPIALVIVAFASEVAALATADHRWRLVSIVTARAGAASALVAVAAGWLLANALRMGGSALLTWHQWLGTAAAGLALAAALSSADAEGRPIRAAWIYRLALLAAAASVAAAAHLGGLLVWGADFLRP